MEGEKYLVNEQQQQYPLAQYSNQYPPPQFPSQYPPLQYQNQYPPQQYPSQYPPQEYPPQQHPNQYPPQQYLNQYPPQQNPGQNPQQTAPTVVVIHASGPVYQLQPAGCCACCIVPSYGGLVILACFVFWCWGPLFGFIAFILALAGRNHEAVGQVLEGRQLAKASFWVSIAGIIVGAIAALAIGLGLGLGLYPYNRGTTAYNCVSNAYGPDICSYF